MNPISVLFEDDNLVVVDKPSGMVVNRAESVTVDTVCDWVEKTYEKIPDDDAEFVSRAGIVHRIDKETSGCLLIAKNTSVFRALQAQFKDRVVKKTYLAIAHGGLVPPEGEIRAPVGRLPWNRERFGILPGGKDAITRYKTVRTKEGNDGTPISLVELYPETGRTHQIRVHLKYINHPIVGDYLYAGRKTARADRIWAPRVMLHAWKIGFLHPVLERTIEIEAPIPDDMKSII